MYSFYIPYLITNAHVKLHYISLPPLAITGYKDNRKCIVPETATIVPKGNKLELSDFESTVIKDLIQGLANTAGE